MMMKMSMCKGSIIVPKTVLFPAVYSYSGDTESRLTLLMIYRVDQGNFPVNNGKPIHRFHDVNLSLMTSFFAHAQNRDFCNVFEVKIQSNLKHSDWSNCIETFTVTYQDVIFCIPCVFFFKFTTKMWKYDRILPKFISRQSKKATGKKTSDYAN